MNNGFFKVLLTFKLRNKTYQLLSDDRQYVLQQLTTKEPHHQLITTIGYYSDVEALLAKLVKLKLLDTNNSKDIKHMFKEALNDVRISLSQLAGEEIVP